jgi:hypothetical protein
VSSTLLSVWSVHFDGFAVLLLQRHFRFRSHLERYALSLGLPPNPEQCFLFGPPLPKKALFPRTCASFAVASFLDTCHTVLANS